MVKASEFQVGNLIGWHEGDKSKFIPVKIHGLMGEMITAFVNGSYQQCHENYQSWMEIPLTEEWLSKLGFKQQGNRKMWVRDRVCVVLESYTDLSGKAMPEAFYIGFKDLGNVLFHTTLKVEYVHTLQNAFALTGEELTIKKQDGDV